MHIYHHISEITNLKNAIVTIGTFDGVHLGHQKIIKRLLEIKQQQGGEVLLFTFSPHPRKVLFPEQTDLRLITTTQEKCDLLQQFGIDHVLVFPFTKAFSQMHATDYVKDIIVKGLKTKTLVIGYDHRFGSSREGNIEMLKILSVENNFTVEEIPVEEINTLNISSSRIRKAIEEGDIETANHFLGRAYSLTGEVVKGDKLGRVLGYPTANIDIDSRHKLIPSDGIYAVMVTHESATYKGMLYIGNRPTINGTKRVIEVNLFDFNKEIYGESLTVYFQDLIRLDEKFHDLEALKSRLHQDRTATLAARGVAWAPD